MTLQALAFTALMARCAPNVAPSTMAAIVRVESGGDPLAIGDNTTSRSYYPSDRASAEALAARLLEARHSLDLGIAQIDSTNFAGFGVDVHTIFDPCVNLSVAAKILSDDYAFARRRYREAQVALRHAIGMYNTGRLNAGAGYAARVVAAAIINAGDAELPRAVAQRDAMQSHLLVRVATTQRKVRGTHRKRITSSRSPILVSNASRLIVF